jgi:DNA-binding transcriptional ArsR family regulator
MNKLKQGIERADGEGGRCCAPLKAAAGAGVPEFETLHYKVRAGVLKALAHPVRLFIVDCLERREHCVGELVEHVGLDQSTVSKHLGVLRAAGIVDDDKRGRETWYSLRIPCVAGFFGCIETALEHAGGGAAGGGAELARQSAGGGRRR